MTRRPARQPEPLPALRCPCGTGKVFAVAPGDEPEHAALIAAPLTAGVPMKVWCRPCWVRDNAPMQAAAS